MTDKPKITLQSLSTSRFGVAFALAVTHYLPRWTGYWVTRNIARLIASRRSSPMIRAMRANQWVVSGEKLTRSELDRVVKTVMLKRTRCLYDFYRNLNRPDEILRLVHFSSEFQPLFDRVKTGKEPALFLTPHTSNFDLAGRAMALRGLKFLVLTVPQPPGGYKWQNQIRAESGIDVLPMSIGASQVAKERLRSGGVVVSGLDRPIQSTRYRPRFFGRPAPLSVAYVHLALQTSVPIYIVSCITLPDRTYEIICQPPIFTEPHPDRETELICNAEKVLKQVEELILRDPIQWGMFYPVWPEALTVAP